ncbi:MAG: NAD(P)H-hydrate dehydratase, partial [Cyclobacteriaceae bacterium]|nr:NAD(P)H-hydrate dehydratase [Cyclobacteriaceae bacterium]
EDITIVSGPGNNGGDGLAVGRLLNEKGYKVNLFVVRTNDTGSDDFMTNLKRYKLFGEIVEIREEKDIPRISSSIIIDALFGSGLSRPLSGIFARVVEYLNTCNSQKISIDIASGLFADLPVSKDSILFKPYYTVTFQQPKFAFFLPENDEFVGSWEVLDIGLDKKYIEQLPCDNFLLEKKDVDSILIPRKRHSHKGTYGKALISTGSYGKMGAAVLCGQAAMRAGLGLLYLHIPQKGYEIIQSTVPEGMVVDDIGKNHIESIPSLENYSAIGFGPGIGTHPDTISVVSKLLTNFQKPMVIDADGINIIAQNRELLEIIPQKSILTPHPGEFERLVGPWKNSFEKHEKQKNLSSKYEIIIVLKGAYTSITFPNGQLYFNPTGNPGMATGGSGDVLTGILVGLLAQGYTPENTAFLGVYLHGQAGDLAAQKVGMQSLIASDIIRQIPKAFDFLK